jgi:flagellar assembly protein FliH
MAAVIRRENLTSSRRFSFQDMEREAGAIIARAQAAAEQLMADTRRQIAEAQERAERQAEVRQHEAREQGLTRGHHDGFEAAKQEARAAAIEAARDELRQLTQALRAALGEFERNKHGLLAVAEAGLIELAVAIARRVCKTLAEAGPESAQANARVLLELVRNQHDLQVRLHPADHELLGATPENLLSQAADLQHVQLSADPAVERGGCVLTSRDGTLDANISTQIDRIAAVICQTLRPAHPSSAAAPPPPTVQESAT